MNDITFLSKITTITSTWLQQINNHCFRGTDYTYNLTLGTTSAYTLALPTASLYSTLLAGDTFRFKLHDTCALNATLNVAGTGAKPLLQQNGERVQAGQLVKNQVYSVTYNGVGWQTSVQADTPVIGLPPQAGNADKWLTTDGTTASWDTITQGLVPLPGGRDGEFLASDGTNIIWSKNHTHGVTVSGSHNPQTGLQTGLFTSLTDTALYDGDTEYSGHKTLVTSNSQVAVATSHIAVSVDGTHLQSRWGIATEAWSTTGAQQCVLVGAEVSIISQYHDNHSGLVGLDVVFKNRPDGFTAPQHGAKGDDNYARHSRAIQIASQAPSTGVGERCGWAVGIDFFENSLATSEDGAAIAFNFRGMVHDGCADWALMAFNSQAGKVWKSETEEGLGDFAGKLRILIDGDEYWIPVYGM